MVFLMSLRKVFLCVFFFGGALFLYLYIHQQSPFQALSPPNESKKKTWQLSGGTEFLPSESKKKSWQLSGGTEFLPNESKKKPWYLSGGTELPKAFKGTPKLFPDQAEGDRIMEQLMYVPDDYKGFDTPEKIILVYDGVNAWSRPWSWGSFASYGCPVRRCLEWGSVAFHGCPVSRCSLTADINKVTDADAILFNNYLMHAEVVRPAKQVWIIYMIECPYLIGVHIDIFNWTATYRRDSDIVAPYGKWTYYDSQVRQKSQMRNYAANKTKKVAWFVSNCKADYTNNRRLEYAHELNKYIPVDIYGSCGLLNCAKGNQRCFELLERDYKFYLAFENNNCRDYITEKLYENSLGHSVLPIVMGARPEDYKTNAPQRSYIHVHDFGSAEGLAAYLHRLDKDDDLYNSYFRWKGTGEFINTYFWCRLCAMLHAPSSERQYKDVNDWWRGPGVCSATSWRNRPIYIGVLFLLDVFVVKVVAIVE